MDTLHPSPFEVWSSETRAFGKRLEPVEGQGQPVSGDDRAGLHSLSTDNRQPGTINWWCTLAGTERAGDAILWQEVVNERQHTARQKHWDVRRLAVAALKVLYPGAFRHLSVRCMASCRVGTDSFDILTAVANLFQWRSYLSELI